ncbi:MAG: hypothetical protein A2068_06780 [Ignavibacteria bacterium GWB2_35_6b]|nr:MAG: hypothetical protein A2068_06780 [Ignavibacteria bacterium GWB2_35_6b]
MTQNNKFFISFYLLLFTSSAFTSVFAQERNLIKYTVENGLSLSQISGIDQSKNGFLVIGTYGGGLSLFDGFKFRNFNSTNGLCNNVIYDLKVDDNNNVWIGTAKGLSKFNGSNFVNYYKEDGLSDEWILSIAIDKNKTVWLGTNKGLTSFSNNNFKNYSDEPLLSDKRIITIAESRSGNLFLGTENGLLSFDGKDFKVLIKNSMLVKNNIYSIYEDKEENLWLGTERGLYLWKNNNLSEFYMPELKKSKIVWKILEAGNRNIFIGTDEGLFVYDFKKFIKYSHMSEGITDYKIWAIAKDRENNTWFGTDDGLYLQVNDIFKRYNDYDGKINAWAFYEDNKNNLWVGTGTKGILKFRNGTFNKVFTGGALKSNAITSIYQDSNNKLWVSNDSGIVIYDGKSFENLTSKINIGQGPVMVVLEDQLRNRYWIATYYNGIYCYDGKNLLHFTEKTGLTNDMVYDLFIDKTGTLWAGSDHGISKFEKNKFEVPDEMKWLNKYAIMKILQDKKGNIWFGTFELGLIKYSPTAKDKSKLFDTVDVSCGLNDNSIMAMSFDKNGDIWMGTNLGINKFDIGEYYKSGRKNVVAYSKGDGFPGVETIQGGVLSDSKGNMWFGTIDGIIKFNPDEIKINTAFPFINITEIETFNSNFERNTIYKNILGEEYYTDFSNLPYDNNNLTINFAGICFTNSSKVKYKYRLNKSEWSPETFISSVSFSNLNSGDYTFEVIASNNNGLWNKVPAKINFTIHTPFYKTWWFYLSGAAITVFLIYFLARLRFKQVETKNKELRERIKERLRYEEKLKQSEQELIIAKEKAEKSDRLKSEFLAQMSHEIRTPVNSILSFTTLLRNELEDVVQDDLKDSFTIIESGGRRLIRTIDSILNMSQLQVGNFETRNDKIDLLIILENLHNEFKNAASQKKLDFRINKAEETFTEIRDEYTVTQLIANLIDNSIKYTPRGFVQINILKNSGGNIVIEVKDSGIGISNEFQKYLFTAFTQEETGYTRKFEGSGLGLALVKKYAELNNIDLSIESEKGNGTTFRVEFLPY